MLLGMVTQNEDLFWVNAFAAQEIIQIHFALPFS